MWERKFQRGTRVNGKDGLRSQGLCRSPDKGFSSGFGPFQFHFCSTEQELPQEIACAHCFCCREVAVQIDRSVLAIDLPLGCMGCYRQELPIVGTASAELMHLLIEDICLQLRTWGIPLMSKREG
ncbi:UNVERIFIED_CONTAM: hypothetical protein K2H54_024814 [Gekko kuhli]